MTTFQWIILLILLITCGLVVGIVWIDKRTKIRRNIFRVTVKFAHGIRTKLVLNSEQYEQFQAWLNRPDGIYEIKDDNAAVTLDRQYVASVEMKRR